MVRQREIEQRLQNFTRKKDRIVVGSTSENVKNTSPDDLPPPVHISTPVHSNSKKPPILYNSSLIGAKAPVVRCAPIKRIIYHVNKDDPNNLPKRKCLGTT